ncbi:uncharacterized protein LOC117555506 [Gymnodraco acuticeps]|uniref:Uncharacterized protein LOC117555506 n=1 Tax=Gymnodraco acuticeps TaxID=8218 RepID=A0A6P8VII6_GYMAC|nr:uncharacterized protein LOC117555506 [Gymnodraco acuticeps]
MSLSLSHKQRSRLSVLDVKMGLTLLCVLGFFLLSLLYRGQAQDAVLTIEPNWTTFFTGESVTFKCDITGGKDSDWYYSIHNQHGEVFSPSNKKFRTLQPLTSGYSGEYQCLFQHGGSTKRSNTIYLTVSDRNVILEIPVSTLFEGESVTLRCRHRTQREENAAFYRDGSLITTHRNHRSPLMAKNTVQVMSDGSSYSCTFGDEESEQITLRTETKPKAQLRDISPGGGNVTLTCSVGLSSASGWRYFWYKKGNTSEPLKTQDVVFLTNDRISVSRGGVYWCRGRRGNPVYYTEYSDAVVTNRAVVTLQPKWPEIYSGETIILTCEIEDGGDYEWEVSWRTPGSNTPQKSHLAPSSRSGKYQCMGRLKGEMSETLWSDVFTLTVSNERPQPVLTVSPSWPSPGASVTMNCSVDHPSAGWSFYWYKAVPQLSGNSYNYELLAGNENGTEQDLFIIDGQTHTAGYVCTAGRGDPVFYSWYSKLVFVLSGDINSAASLTVSPDSVQHFTKTPVSLSCEGNSTEWRVRRFSKYNNLRHCSSWGTMTGSTCTITRSRFSGVYWCESETGQFSNAVNITKDDGEIILVSPVRLVAEGRPVTLSCKLKTETVYNVDFYKNDKLIQNDTRSELTISAVSKSDEGFYKCKQRDSADGWTSPESWLSVKSASGPGKDSQFPVLPIVGLLCGVLLIILLLLLLYLYRKSKDSCYSRSQKTNQGPATDHMINQDETNQREYASVLQSQPESLIFFECTVNVINRVAYPFLITCFKKCKSSYKWILLYIWFDFDFSSDNACLYETVKGPEEPANDESMDVTYSVLELKHISKKGKSSPAPADETVYSELKPGTALGKNAACTISHYIGPYCIIPYTATQCQRNSLSVLDVKMGHTLLSLLGFLLLNLLYRGQAQDAVLTIEPNWTTFFFGGSVTFKCDITGDKDSGWFYSMYKDGQGFLPYGQHESYKLPHLTTNFSGEYQCLFQHGGSTIRSNKIYLNVSERPLPVVTVSPSWQSPGASVTLNCRVDHPSAGWSFYWYKAVPRLSGNSYSYELLPGSENGTEQDLFIIDGQTHTAGYYCRAGTGDPVFYSLYSKRKFVWSGDINSAASLTVSPDSVQHFTKTPVSLSCEGNSTEWRVRRFSKSGNLLPCSSWGTMTGSTCTISRSWLSGVYWCESETGQFSNAVNITMKYDDIILVSPVRPVAEGLPGTLSCKLKTGTALYDVDFYKNDELIQNYNRRELTISAVSKSDEGFYKCKRRDSVDGRTSSKSWFSVKSASGHGEASEFPVLLIVGLLCGVSLIILLLLFLYLYRKSKDSCYSRSQRTNQSPATDHMINQDETNQREYASVLQDNACLYATVKGPREPANDESRDVTYSVVKLKNISKKGKKNEPEDCVYSDVQMASAAADESRDVTYSVVKLKNISKKGKKNEPEDCVYSHVQMASAAGKSSPAPADETVYSELKPGTALGKNAA